MAGPSNAGRLIATGFVISIFSSGLGSISGAAQVRDTTRTDSTVVTLPGLVVRASTPVTTVGGASAIRARLDSMPVPVASTLDRIFRAMPALHVRRNARGESEVSVRGSDSRQVAVLVDGIPLNLAWDGRADVSVIPATAPQDINFVRGLSSMLHGPNVLGGVVELNVGQSLLQPASPSASVAADVDHIGGTGTNLGISLPAETDGGRWLVRLGGSHRDSPGDPLARGVVEPVATANRLRLNTDVTSLDGFASIRYARWSGAWFSFSGSTFSADRGIAAELGTEDARFWRYPHMSRTLIVASGGTGERGTPLGYGDLEASIGVDVGRTEIDSYTSRAYAEQDEFEDGSDRTLTLRMLGDHTLGERGEFRASFTLSDITHDEFLPAGDARYRQRLMSIGSETAWRLFENRLRLSIGGAYDVGQTPESGGRDPLGTIAEWGGRIGATIRVADGTTVLHGGASRRGRFPALRELYSGSLNRFAPNPDLTPESLVAIEIGVTTRIGPAEVQAVGFRHQLNDAVVRTTLPDGRFFRVNRDRLESLGMELLGSGNLGPVYLSGDVTLQSVDITDTQADEVNRPENLPEVYGGVRAAVPLPWDIRSMTEVRYTGKQYCIEPGTGEDAELQGRAVINGSVARTWHLHSSGTGWFGRLETRVAVDNAGDIALFDQCGLPQPGRLFRFEVRVF
jgi:iron complex outermembrane receptor protein